MNDFKRLALDGSWGKAPGLLSLRHETSVSGFFRSLLEQSTGRKQPWTFYKVGDAPIAINNRSRTRPPIIVPVEVATWLRNRPYKHIKVGKRVHRSNLGLYFPKRQHTSKGLTGFGYRLEVTDIAGLQSLRESLLTPDLQTNADEPGLGTADLTSTERRQLILARRGQGHFREKLDKVWKHSCAVTGNSVRELLRASHIRRWQHSSNTERLNADNGLLLIANLDAAFDAGLLSFEDDGKVVYSSDLGTDPHLKVGLPAGAAITTVLNDRQRSFLKHHREHYLRDRAC